MKQFVQLLRMPQFRVAWCSCLGLILGLVVLVPGAPELARGADSQPLFRQGSQKAGMAQDDYRLRTPSPPDTSPAPVGDPDGPRGAHQQAAPGSPCPDGKPMVACLLNPCQVSRCPNFPQAICKANYCGGCFAVWSVDGKPVDCGPVDPVQQGR
jgi:hypothetical protein